MAFLPALAAAGTAGAVSSTAGAAALAKLAAASSASGALGAGLTAGTAIGTGAAMTAMPALSYAGANLAAPTAGIFANAAPALGGLQSLTPAASGFKSLAMANAPLTSSPFGAVNQAVGLGDIGTKAANLPQMLKTSTSAGDIASKSFVPQASPVNPAYEAQAMAARDATTASKVAEKFAADQAAASAIQPDANFLSNLGNLIQNPSMQGLKDYVKEHPAASAGIGYKLYKAMSPDYDPPETSKGKIRPYKFERGPRQEAYAVSPTVDSSERRYFTDTFTALEPYEAPGPEYEKEAASGGLMGLAVGGPVEQMSAMNAVGGNTTYPQAQLQTSMYSNPMVQRPVQSNVISQGIDAPVDPYSGEQKFAEGGEAKTEGGYKYAFDPKTQVFTQLSVPKLVPETRQSNYIGGGMGGGAGQQYVRYAGEGKPPGDDYQYMPGGMSGPAHYLVPASSQATPTNTGPKVSGGIATPTGGLPPLAPTAPTAPPQPPMDVPAYQSPEERLGLTDFYKMMNQKLAQQGGYAAGGGVYAGGGGVYDLGGYSDGGRLLRGPGDGVSDSIPAVIGNRQPARLADGEFVVPARIVSELGNGSTEAGARKLYAMMDRVQKARRKTVGKNKVAANTKADKFLPA